ncbi:50S ribosomal protein L18 [Candidatus Woesearchaeota archaeon]|nr:50S ribosomal protein L18 [Candidatus Woesearchaeota archaeon]
MKKQKFLLYRRKREGKTDYKKRLKLLVSEKPRLIIRRSLRNVTVQVINYRPNGDETVFSASAKQLVKFGWTFDGRNLPSAYLTGLLCGVKAKKENFKGELIVDFGLQKSTPRGLLYAAVKGAIDAGLNVLCGKEVFPSPDRLSGKHIADYVAVVAQKKVGQQFSKYAKQNLKAEDIPKKFVEVKAAIISGVQTKK